jgi:hypothetical protein
LVHVRVLLLADEFDGLAVRGGELLFDVVGFFDVVGCG